MGGRGASSGINRVGVNKLKKGIKSYHKRIKEHQYKIKNPKSSWGDRWDTFDKERKQNEINHWKTEIAAFRKNIRDDTEKIRRYKENDKP